MTESEILSVLKKLHAKVSGECHALRVSGAEMPEGAIEEARQFKSERTLPDGRKIAVEHPDNSPRMRLAYALGNQAAILEYAHKLIAGEYPDWPHCPPAIIESFKEA